MNFKKLLIGAFALSAMLAACVDDSTSAKDTDQSDELVETFDDLPVCSDNREGATAYVKDEKNAYMCVDGDWVPEEENSSSSIASSSSTIRNDSSSSSAMETSSSSAVESSSSSETTQSSSSSENISAGSVYDATAKTLKDLRDGQTYKTVVIGEQTWMAENLNYRYLGPTATLDSSSFCYGDDSANCTKYGRLYLWSAAMDSAGVIKGNTANGCGNASKCTPSGNVHGVCPQGWHLPSRDEWEVLFTTVGGWPTAGAKLKSTYGWNDYYGDRGNGDDAFGFSALSAGHRDNDGDYGSEGYYAYFWSSTEYDGDGAYYMYTNFSKDSAYYQSDIEKYEGFSVRCLKD